MSLAALILSLPWRRGLALWLAVSWPTFALAVDITLVVPDAGAPYREAAEALRDELRRGDTGGVALQSLSERHPGRGEDLVVAVGLTALRAVLDEPGETPIWALMVPRAGFERLAGNRRRPVAALYLDQPLERQLRLLAVALPEAGRVGVLIGRGEAAVGRQVAEAAGRVGRPIEIVYVDSPEESLSALDGLKERHADVLWLLPDPAVASRALLQPLLLQTYRLGLPVLAYSNQLVEAGALLALHAAPADIGREAAERLLHSIRKGVLLPTSDYPRAFDVAVNTSVATSLGLRLHAAESIRRGLEKPRGGR